MKIPCLSVQQPWASLIMNGEKPVENRPRPWMRDHVWGPEGKVLLGIHSSTTIQTDGEKEKCAPGWQADPSLPFGSVLGVVELVRICRRGELRSELQENKYVRREAENWCWELERPRKCSHPIDWPGQSSLFYADVSDSEMNTLLQTEAYGLANDFRYLTVTAANLRNGSLSVTGAQDLFPEDLFGDSSKKAKYKVYILCGNQIIDTDIVRPKKIFRRRKWGSFFDANRIRPGDRVRIERLEPYLYRVSKAPRV